MNAQRTIRLGLVACVSQVILLHTSGAFAAPLEADTPTTTTFGNPFIAPAEWSLQERQPGVTHVLR
jgi:hypothetical protein